MRETEEERTRREFFREPGVGPKITQAELLEQAPVGTSVAGLAPIGTPWGGTIAVHPVTKRKYIRPRQPCPVGEFSPTAVQLDGVWYWVQDPPQHVPST